MAVTLPRQLTSTTSTLAAASQAACDAKASLRGQEGRTEQGSKKGQNKRGEGARASPAKARTPLHPSIDHTVADMINRRDMLQDSPTPRRMQLGEPEPMTLDETVSIADSLSQELEEIRQRHRQQQLARG